MTVWSPDSCGCVLEYEWDDSVPAEQREHKVRKVVRNCGAHGNRESDHEHFKAVLGENQRKNRAIDSVMKLKGIVRDQYEEGPDGDEQYSKDFSRTLAQIDWRHDPPDQNGDRILRLTVKDKKTSKQTLEARLTQDGIRMVAVDAG